MRKGVFCCILFLLSCSFLGAQTYCADDRFSQIALFDSTSIRIERSIVYGNAHNLFSGRKDTLLLDLYYPALTNDTLAQRPLIVFTHGGSFEGGTRNDFAYLCFEMARRGYVAASIDYRLGWGCGEGAPCLFCIGDTSGLRLATYMATQDLLASLRFLSANAVSWHIDPDAVFVAGASAGAITSFAAASWTQRDADRFAPVASAVAGGLSHSGNTASGHYTIRGIASFCGAFPGDSSLLSALHLPVISFHDEYDCVMPYASGTLFGCNCAAFYPCSGPAIIHRYLAQRSICSSNFVYANNYHHCDIPEEESMLAIASFFKSILCGPCGAISLPPFSAQVSRVPCDREAVVSFADYAHHGGTIHCLNAMGQEVYRQVYHEFDAYAILDTQSFAPGIYYLVFECAENPSPLKMLVVHP